MYRLTAACISSPCGEGVPNQVLAHVLNCLSEFAVKSLTQAVSVRSAVVDELRRLVEPLAVRVQQQQCVLITHSVLFQDGKLEQIFIERIPTRTHADPSPCPTHTNSSTPPSGRIAHAAGTHQARISVKLVTFGEAAISCVEDLHSTALTTQSAC